MKKILTMFVISLFAIVGFGQASTPELLKNKEMFEKTDLFEPPQVFADKAVNASVLRDYELNKATYKSSQLLPVAVCYLSFGDMKKAQETFEAFLSAKPNNLRAIRTLGTISLLSKDIDKAIEYYKKAIALGDEKSVVFVGSAYIMANKQDEIKPHLPVLKKLAKTNLEALNVVLIYAGRDKKNFDEALAKEVLASVDARAVLESATPDGMSTILRIYVATRKIWNTTAMLVPARAATLVEAWPLAMQVYKTILAEQPNNPLALRGVSVVAFRTGDVFGAADYIMKAYKAGDKDAAMDGVELFLLSRNRAVWDMFKDIAKGMSPNPQVCAGLVQYAVSQDDCIDMFYFASLSKNTDLLYKDQAVSKLLEEGAKKYSSDKRSAEVLKRLKEFKK